MNFLELCQEVVAEVGYSGNFVRVTQQRGQFGNVVRWVRNANNFLQTEHSDWIFMNQDFEFETVQGQSQYTEDDLAAQGVENVWHWHKESFKVDKGDDKHYPMHHLHRQLFDRYYRNKREGRPIHWTEIGVGLEIAHIPDDVYTIRGRYQINPVTLKNDLDVPIIPEKHHMAIVWKAVAYYGQYEEAPLLLARGEEEYRKELNKMRSIYLPDVMLRGSSSWPS